MPVPVTFNGETIALPSYGDAGWGDNVTKLMVDLSGFVNSLVLNTGGVDLVSNQVVFGVKTFADGLMLSGSAIPDFKSTGINDQATATALTIDAENNITLAGTLTGTVIGNADTASALKTARTIALTGPVTGSTTFNGAANASITTSIAPSGITPGTYSSLTLGADGRATAGGTASAIVSGDVVGSGPISGLSLALAPTGVTAGTYTKLTIDAKGRVTAATSPTTLSGYGITDAYTTTAADARYAAKATTLAGYGITDAYTKAQADAGFAAKSTTLTGYGIADAYTKAQTDAGFAAKATTLAGYGIGDAYTKAQTDAGFAAKSTTLAGYAISDGVQNAGGAPSLATGNQSARPSAGTAGRLFVARDTQTVFLDTGLSWVSVGGGGSGGGGSLAPSVTVAVPATSSTTVTTYEAAVFPNLTIQYSATRGGRVEFGSVRLWSDGTSTELATSGGGAGTGLSFSAAVSGGIVTVTATADGSDGSATSLVFTTGVQQADGTNRLLGDLDMGGHKITSLATPTAASDASPKGYADAAAAAAVAASRTADVDMGGHKAVNLATPTASTDASTKGYVDTAVASALPPGVTLPYAGSTAPAGFLLANGQAVSRTTYAALFAVIGTTYGTGNGSTTFNVPDLCGRVAAGLDNMGGGTAASRLGHARTGGLTAADAKVLGKAGGQNLHTLASDEIVAHNHPASATASGPTVTGLGSDAAWTMFQPGGNALGYGQVNTTNSVTVTVGNNVITGGQQAMNVVQPTLMLNYLIKT